MDSDLALFTNLVGEPVVAAERCAMGFENRTDMVTLASGETRIVQQITNRGMAAHKTRLARLLPERLSEVGLRAPQVLRADAQATPPFLVREYIEGTSGSSLLATSQSAVSLAEVMGAALPKLALVRIEGLGLNTAWANPARVVAHATKQLERRREVISAAHAKHLHAIIRGYESLFKDRSGVFAHGDFCPINTIFSPANGKQQTTNNGQLILIDLEFARVADQLFDLAWWSWVVRYHHEAQWHGAFPCLLRAANIPDDKETHARIRAIQHLRLLEALDYNAALSPERGAAWAERLAATLEWQD